jgi:hypothetical protein
MSDILKEFFGSAQVQPETNANSYFGEFGLPENPFPPNRRIVAKVLYGQQQAYDRFRELARDLLQASAPQRLAMGVVAGTGGGKTHFLRYCQYKFSELCRALRRPLAVVEYTAGTLKVLDLVREIYRQCDATCRQHSGTDFLTTLAQALSGPGADTTLATLSLEDARSALGQLLMAHRSGKDYDLTRELCWRWLRAETLTVAEKKRLAVASRLASATVAVRTLGQVLDLARRLRVVEGVLLCLDELEALFSMGARFAQVQAFLHDLRYLYDDSVRGTEGYGLLIVTASTGTGLSELRVANYPVFQRFGFEEGARVELRRIQGVAEAISFAHHYIDYFHKRWQEAHPGQQPPRKPYEVLSNADIEAAFLNASGGVQAPPLPVPISFPPPPGLIRGARPRVGAEEAPQGPLLDALHRKVEEVRQQGTSEQRG